MSVHVTADTNNTPVVQSNQSTILKCNQCGRMFFNRERFEEHIRDDHEGRQASVDTVLPENSFVPCRGDCGGLCNGECEESRSASLDHEDAPPENNDDAGQALVWAKITSIFWPARIIRKLRELTEIQLFDEERSKKVIQNT